MTYKVVEADDIESLTEKVNHEISNGWNPIGGMSVYFVQQRDGYGNKFYINWFAQALTKQGSSK